MLHACSKMVGRGYGYRHTLLHLIRLLDQSVMHTVLYEVLFVFMFDISWTYLDRLQHIMLFFCCTYRNIQFICSTVLFLYFKM